MDLVWFVLLVGALVLVHELGHFVAARILGVKVLTFSLGFGPTLFQIRGRETTYRLALLPFGGFVKLLEDPAGRRSRERDAVAHDPPSSKRARDPEAQRSFQAQSLPRRAMIALAGPAMNLVVPLFLYFGVFLDEGKVPPPTIGVVVAGSAADGLLRAGDRVVAIDGAPIETYAEVQRAIVASAGKPLILRVARTTPDAGGKSHDETVDVRVVPAAVAESRALGESVTVGRLGIGPSPLAAVIGVVDPSSPAGRAGLRTFDLVTHVGGVATPRLLDLERLLHQNLGTAVPVRYLRPTRIAWAGGFAEMAVYEAHVAVLAPDPVGAIVDTHLPHLAPTFVADGWEGLHRAGIESSDLYVATVTDGSSEAQAGLRAGDRIDTLDGAPVKSWSALTADLVAGGDRARELTWIHEGEPMRGILRVHKEEWIDATGERVARYVFRSTHFAPTVPEALVAQPHPIVDAARRAFAETGKVARFLVSSAAALVEGRLTMRAISGPIAIYDVAGKAGARGARDFLWVMALVSINLGLLNLLPIPTLDGGQLLFLAIEAITRRPVPMRVREVASIAGLSMLVLLMAIAVRNDVGRHWDTLVPPVRRLFG